MVISLGIGTSVAQTRSPLQEFTQLLSGFYSTEAMWKKDTAFSHVELHIVPIWKGDQDGYWFYLEQAQVSSLQRPYRQAILHITSNGTAIISSNLSIKNRLGFAGAWKEETLLQKLSKADIDSSNSCNIIFVRTAKNRFKGSTAEGGCANRYRGASYFTNESELTEKGLKSWDRGWTEDGQLAWGPANHGYTFDRLPN